MKYRNKTQNNIFNMELVFATNNQHKINEVAPLMPASIKLIGLKQLGFNGDIPETADTLEGNASMKSYFIYNQYNTNCFSDDTGLEIDALNGEPGVYSARYAGEGCSFKDNIMKVLTKLHGVENRKAKFRTVISLIINGKEYLFEGKIEGQIIKEVKGSEGFGYDPIFLPDGYNITFAQMPLEQKNVISHRALAVKKLVDFLYNYKSIN